MAGVSLREERVSIPTYPIGAPEVNPIFFAGRGYQGARGPVYPYPFLDKLTDRITDKSYTSLTLENEYVEVQVLPEIGGRIFTARDKTNGYDFFYRQSVVKPALIGMLGAWISGGVEWNVFHHHRPTTFMPVDWRVEEGADGSRTVWVGELELRQRMRWAIGMTLQPGRSCLEVTVKLFNRTPLAHSMLYFTNAAVHVNDSYQVIFPPSTEWGTHHAKGEYIEWPVAHRRFAGGDYRAGVDVSWWRNHPGYLSIFTMESEEDFFGGYDHGRDAGTVHVADHHVSPGKKFFTFGNGDPGRMWDHILTDADGPYLELMAGSYSDNQPDYSWIEPGETRIATEWWYPVRGLAGGFKDATVDAAVNLDIEGRAARFAFNATSAVRRATALARVGDRVVFEREIDIDPAAPFAAEVTLPEGARPEDLRVALLDASGRELVSYRPRPRRNQPEPRPVTPPPAPEKVRTNEGLYLAGLRLEQFHNPALEGEPYYREALRRDPGDYRANVALALDLVKRFRLEEAEALLRAAVERATANHTRPKDGEALYYLGVVLRLLGRRGEAVDTLNRVAWCFAWRAAARMQLAEMALEDGDAASALFSVDESLAANAGNVKALALKSAALRGLDRAADALAAANAGLALDPLDHLSASERVLALAALGRPEDALREGAALERLMRGDVQSYLELAWDYAGWGHMEEATAALERYLALQADPAAASPLVHYALAWFAPHVPLAARPPVPHIAPATALAGKPPVAPGAARGDKPAGTPAADGPASKPDVIHADYAFPFRIEEMLALRRALERDPDDSAALYLLGNLLYDRQPREALACWEESAHRDGAFPTVHRNIAFAAAHVIGDHRRAAESLKRAFELAPGDARVLVELDIELAATGAPHAERLALLESHASTVAKRDDVTLRLVGLYNIAGAPDKALAILDARHFHIWEGGETGAHDHYANAHLLRGRRRMERADYAAALADFEAALEYPPRFELGRPVDGGREPEALYQAGLAAEALGEGAKARAFFEQAALGDKRGTPIAYWQALALRRLGREDEACVLLDDLAATGERMLTRPDVDFFEKFGQRLAGAERMARGHYLSGLACLGTGDAAGAREHLRQAIEADPNHLWAREMLASPDA